MPIRTRIEPDKFENFLISKTEQTVNTAFLWLIILKELEQESLTASELKRKIAYKHHSPHRTTFFTIICLLRTMKVIEKTDNKKYKITPKGKLVLDRAVKHLKMNLAIFLG